MNRTPKYALTLFVGGVKDGELLNVDLNAHAIYAPEPVDLFARYEDDGIVSSRLKVQTYQWQKIAMPDRWVERVLVLAGTDLASFTERDLIGFVMTAWRARHAAEAAAR